MSSGSNDWRRFRLCDVLEGGRRRRRSSDASRAAIVGTLMDCDG